MADNILPERPFADGVPTSKMTPAEIGEAVRSRFSNLGARYGPREIALTELAAITRDLVEEVTSTSGGTPETIEQAAALVRQAVALMQAGPHDRQYLHGAEGSMAGGATTSFFDYSPFVGPLSPLSPPMRMEMVGDRVVGRAVYQRQFEGPPSCLHGGLIAAGFDEVLGFAQSLSGRPGMTGRLEVRYRSPTPLFEEVVYEGWLVKVEGRKILTEGTLHAGDRLCAEATGLFISFRVPPSDPSGGDPE
jgi:acyl-coenzyme A thioesterase PaaI-like protein